METPLLVTGAVVAPALLVCVLALLLRDRAGSRRALSAAQLETAELRCRLDDLTGVLETQAATMVRVDDPAYVITDAGLAGQHAGPHSQSHSGQNVADRVVLSATLGEPLLKAVALAHGVRRALAAESRNRIWFEVRREVRRARRRRRRETKHAWRRTRAEDRAPDADAA